MLIAQIFTESNVEGIRIKFLLLLIISSLSKRLPSLLRSPLRLHKIHSPPSELNRVFTVLKQRN